MTDKQLVQRMYPNAYAYRWAGPAGWMVYFGNFLNLSPAMGEPTARQAWTATRKALKIRRPGERSKP